jgi:hypothetical protein
VAVYECKAGQTLSGSHFRNLAEFVNLRGEEETKAFLVYGGDEEYRRDRVQTLPWWRI